MPGGGPSGAVDWPDYMENIHVDWLTGGTIGTPDPQLTTPIEDVMDTALAAGGNPYDGEDAYDPSSHIDSMQSELDAAEAIVDDIDPEGSSGLFESYIDKAVTEVDAVVVSESEITNAVDNFEASINNRRLRELSRFTGGMADINAVDSSQFIIGLALLESMHTDEVNRFEHNLRLQLKRDRQQLVFSAVGIMLDMFRMKLSSSLDLSRLQNDVSRLSIIAEQEQHDRDLELDVLDATWDLTVYQYGANLLAAISGAAHPKVEGLSKVQSALGGALSGAASGAVVGSAVPGVGTALGAGIGAGVGLIAGLLN